MEPSPEDLLFYKALRGILGRLRLALICGTARGAKAATRPQQKTTRTFGDREHAWCVHIGLTIACKLKFNQRYYWLAIVAMV